MTDRTVLITGCTSGFGKLAVHTFRANGWNVVATMRSPEKEAELTGLEGVLVTRLDVKDPRSIDAAFEQGTAAFGSIDAVVNNAGYGSNALFEQSPDASVRDGADAAAAGRLGAAVGPVALRHPYVRAVLRSRSPHRVVDASHPPEAHRPQARR